MSELPQIDLRSDTVTRPTPEMRRAMAEAEVGDDVFGEDPTVRRLEEEAAAAMGHEAALFVPSGTLGNQLALLLLSGASRPGRSRWSGGRGGEVICEARSHIVQHELGAMAAISGLLPHALHGDGGCLDPAAVEAAVRPDSEYLSRTVLLCVENTHNMAGGRVLRRRLVDELLEVADRHHLPAHLDGARLFNAAAALETTPADLARGFDSVMFCLSKGLGAPVGSMLCGPRDFVAEARRARKMLGGGLHQVGVLAAAGLVALRDGPERLPEDHAKARRLAQTLDGLPGLEVDPGAVETNILFLRYTGPGGAPALAAALEALGVLVVAVSAGEIRLVTHRDVSPAQIERVGPALETALARLFDEASRPVPAG